MQRAPRENLMLWKQEAGISVAEIARGIGDPGGQLAQWACGNRKTLPLALKCRLASYTGIPLRDLLEEAEQMIIMQACALVARDAAR